MSCIKTSIKTKEYKELEVALLPKEHSGLSTLKPCLSVELSLPRLILTLHMFTFLKNAKNVQVCMNFAEKLQSRACVWSNASENCSANVQVYS